MGEDGAPDPFDTRVVSRADAVAAVLALLSSRRRGQVVDRRSDTVWVGIDGKGAAGKTSFAAELAAELPGAVTVHIDDFARPGLRGWERDRFVAQVLQPLLGGRPAEYERWDFVNDVSAGWTMVPVGVPVVVEGVSATDVRLGVPWDVTVWLEVPAEVRLRRALARDGPTLQDRWLTDWIPSEDDYERAQRPQERVDLVVVHQHPPSPQPSEGTPR